MQESYSAARALTSMVGGYGADYLLSDEQLSRVNGQYQLQSLASVPGPAVTAQAGYNNIIVTTTRDKLVGGFGGATLITNGNPQPLGSRLADGAHRGVESVDRG